MVWKIQALTKLPNLAGCVTLIWLANRSISMATSYTIRNAGLRSKMKQIELEVTSRNILGKKTSMLRRQGITPIHLFGHNIKSLPLQCDTVHLRQILTEAGKTSIINLKLNKIKKARRVLVREVQSDPLSGNLIHVDLYQIRAADRIRVEVPLTLAGEAPALKTKDNMLIQQLHSLAVECLPDKIPASIEIDLSSLSEAGQVLRVRNVKLAEGVRSSTDPETTIVRISAKLVEKVIEEPALKAEEMAAGETATDGEEASRATSTEKSPETVR